MQHHTWESNRKYTSTLNNTDGTPNTTPQLTEAIKKDSCVPDAYANINKVEDGLNMGGTTVRDEGAVDIPAMILVSDHPLAVEVEINTEAKSLASRTLHSTKPT
ncbi:hypothetical protein V496_00481 [Pseudogymnoascus sp. VKM F-4515 (FW-2607)]|nr:hypothetical protein V496_00481 [Pseudogymnoascus sp. VKM F-4515 (FW-2607)]